MNLNLILSILWGSYAVIITLMYVRFLKSYRNALASE